MKTKQDIYVILEEMLVEDFEVNVNDINLNAKLYEELDLDSIDAIDMLVKLRELTGSKIDPEAFKKVRTVDDIVEEVFKLL